MWEAPHKGPYQNAEDLGTGRWWRAFKAEGLHSQSPGGEMKI